MAKGSLPGAVLGERLAKLVLTKSSSPAVVNHFSDSSLFVSTDSSPDETFTSPAPGVSIPHQHLRDYLHWNFFLFPSRYWRHVPRGFAAMMRLYSHAVVDRVQVTFGVTPSVGGNIPDDYDLQSRPFTASSLIIPWYDFDNGNNLTPEQIQSYPGCVTKMIGARSADGEVRFYQSVDIRTALANYREEHYACKSTSASYNGPGFEL